MKQQFVATHTICQTEIPTLIDSCVTNTTSVKMLCPQKNCLSSHYHKNITCLRVGHLMICQVFSVSCKTVYRWVMTNCCFMSVTDFDTVTFFIIVQAQGPFFLTWAWALLNEQHHSSSNAVMRGSVQSMSQYNYERVCTVYEPVQLSSIPYVNHMYYQPFTQATWLQNQIPLLQNTSFNVNWLGILKQNLWTSMK